jgi:cell wall integrity and stress response component
MKSTTILGFAFYSFTGVMAANKAAETSKVLGVPEPSQIPKVGAIRSQGCWGAKGDTWELIPTLEFPSSGACSRACKADNATVAGIHAEECWCGMDYPPKDTYADDSKCDYPCPGYDLEACGAIGSPGYYGVFNTGVKADVPNAEGTTTSSAVISTSTNASGETLIVTQAPVNDPDEKSGGGSNTVGIAVGVVVGLVLLAAALGAGYFWMRKKKRQEEAEERRRADAVSAFVGGSKPSSISGSFADSRLDPVMAHRRMSDGSIADNHDYSRKILRVTNA